MPQDQPGADWMSWNPYTPAFNSAQVPALSYPVWAQGAALPAGVQWVAPKYREDRLLAMGRWMETRFPVRIAPEQVSHVSRDTDAARPRRTECHQHESGRDARPGRRQEMIDYTPGKPDFNILRLGHIEYLVSDLARARDFYVDVVGLFETESDADHVCAPSRTASITAWC